MSGKRHHFVPQFIQRGFASHISADRALTWVYRKGKTPFGTNIINVGIEKDFYMHKGHSQIDDAITEAEGRFGSLLNTLRNSAAQRLENRHEIAQLIAHLETRNRHLRENFTDIAGMMMSQWIHFASDPNQLASLLDRQIVDRPDALQKIVSEELQKSGLPSQLAPQLLKRMKDQVPIVFSQELSMLAESFDHLQNKLPNAIKKIARAGQLRSLSQSIYPQKRVELYRELHYQLIDVTGPLPLGDSIVVFHVEDANGFKSFTQADDLLLAVVLPITPTRLLCGSRRDYILDSGTISTTLIQCSLEYFIANARSPEFEALQLRIGETAALKSTDEIKEIMMEAINRDS